MLQKIYLFLKDKVTDKNTIPVLYLSLCVCVLPVWASDSQDSVQNNIQTLNDIVENGNNLTEGDTLPDQRQRRGVITDNDTILIPIEDTSLVLTDTILPVDTVMPDTPAYQGIMISPDAPEAPIIYSADDSIIYDIASSKIYLFGNAQVDYQNIILKAKYIEFDWVKNELLAEGEKDTLGNYIGYADFTESGQLYQSRKMRYNFKTQKGKAYQVRTQEGEGFIHGEQVKKVGEEAWYGQGAKYTTCNLDEPHFHIAVNRYKLVPEKVMVTGPANLVIADIPTPLFIPFGIFPVQQGRTSGIILPEYGETAAQGFFLRNGGYYFGISDYFDLALRGDIYSRGSWGVRATSNYRKRYKHNGSVNLQYARTHLGERILPESQTLNDFKVNWSHQQDPKARPTSRFSANVNVGTATYDRNHSVAPTQVLNNSFVSNISYSKTFPGRPFSLNANIRHDQSLTTNQVNLELPSLSFAVNRINPFERKVVTGQRRWYERIGFSYRTDFRNLISGTDSTFFTSQTLENAQYAVRHSLPISTSFNVFNHLNIEPSIQTNQRWYFESVRKSWDDTVIEDESGISHGRVVTDTIPGFNIAADFNASIGLNTRLYGMLNFGDRKIQAIRHVFSPTLSFEYRPDFAAPGWGYYRDVQVDTAGNIQRYSIFESVQNLYGTPPQGEVAGLRLNLSNNLEMKVFSQRDTVNQERKIRILERFNVSTFYNFAADSVNLSPINVSAYTTLFDRINLNASANFDPYVADTANINNRMNTFEWTENNRLARLTTANVSVTSSFSSGRRETLQTDAGTPEERQMVYMNPDRYADYNIPWTFGFGYNLNLRKGTTANPDSLILTQSLTFNIDINITDNWKFIANTGYDFVNNEVTYTTLNITRDLHCWEMRVTWVPYPFERQQYSIDINVKSAVLQDLKLSRKRDRFDPVF